MKKILFSTLILTMHLLTNVASADAVSGAEEAPAEDPSSLVPLEKCNSENYLKCDTIPDHVEVPVSSALALDKSWGKAFITSKPRAHMANGALNIEVEVSVQCKDGQKKTVVIPKMMICGYPNVRTQTDLESWALTVTHDPALNLKEEGQNLTLQFNEQGGKIPANGVCRAETAGKKAVNPCLKSASEPIKPNEKPTTP